MTQSFSKPKQAYNMCRPNRFIKIPPLPFPTVSVFLGWEPVLHGAKGPVPLNFLSYRGKRRKDREKNGWFAIIQRRPRAVLFHNAERYSEMKGQGVNPPRESTIMLLEGRLGRNLLANMVTMFHPEKGQIIPSLVTEEDQIVLQCNL